MAIFELGLTTYFRRDRQVAMDGNGGIDIPFTQYLRPDGRKRPMRIARPVDIADMATRVLAAGYHFDIEELMTGHISMTCEPDQPDSDGEDAAVAWEICENGPPVLDAVDRLVRAAGKFVMEKDE